MTITWRRGAILTATVLLLLGTALTDHARADGGGGSDSRESLSRGKPEDPDYTAAVRAIKADKYAEAIPMLQRVVGRDAKNADAFNWLAYATRRNGDAAAALPLYEKALAIDPKHRGAHEYIGEAYLMTGNLTKAEQHLAELQKLCSPIPCEESKDLQRAIDDYKKKKK